MPYFDCQPDNTQALFIDVQERFVDAIPTIKAGQATATALTLLLRGCNLLALPALLTRQYPQGLGDTVDYLRSQQTVDAVVADKTHFSVLDDRALRQQLADSNRDYVVVAGVEAHVCVLATVDDLLRRGYQVAVAADAVASRNPEHGALALATMRQLGALVLPVESILFRLQRQAGIGNFKALRDLIK